MTDRKEYYYRLECAYRSLAAAYKVDPFISDETLRAELVETYKCLAEEAKRALNRSDES